MCVFKYSNHNFHLNLKKKKKCGKLATPFLNAMHVIIIKKRIKSYISQSSKYFYKEFFLGEKRAKQ